MTDYKKPTLEECVIFEEDVIMSSGVTLTPDEFDDETTTTSEF